MFFFIKCLYMSFPAHWENEACSLEDLFRGIVYCFQLMTSEEETQRRGLVVIFDMKGSE